MGWPQPLVGSLPFVQVGTSELQNKKAVGQGPWTWTHALLHAHYDVPNLLSHYLWKFKLILWVKMKIQFNTDQHQITGR